MNGQNDNAWKTAFFVAALGVTIIGLCLGAMDINRMRANNPVYVEFGLRYIWNTGLWRIGSIFMTVIVFAVSFFLSFVKDQEAWGLLILVAWTFFAGVLGFLMWLSGYLMYVTYV